VISLLAAADRLVAYSLPLPVPCPLPCEASFGRCGQEFQNFVIGSLECGNDGPLLLARIHRQGTSLQRDTPRCYKHDLLRGTHRGADKYVTGGRQCLSDSKNIWRVEEGLRREGGSTWGHGACISKPLRVNLKPYSISSEKYIQATYLHHSTAVHGSMPLPTINASLTTRQTKQNIPFLLYLLPLPNYASTLTLLSTTTPSPSSAPAKASSSSATSLLLFKPFILRVCNSLKSCLPR
jgi:hypothetical protein